MNYLLGRSGSVKVTISSGKKTLGREAAKQGAECIRRALRERRRAAVILATGASQFEMLDALVREAVDWSRVEAFHLDEYIGLPEGHPASFRRYLRERFHERLPVPLDAFHYIDGETDPAAECERLRALITPRTIDAAFVGIGENGHLAFNDPPADFVTEAPYLVVDLDEACRMQQVGEGWFDTLEEVPRQAISMSIREILRSRAVICTVPDGRKAEAVKGALEGPVTPELPASILREHPRCWLFLDRESAAGLKENGN